MEKLGGHIRKRDTVVIFSLLCVGSAAAVYAQEGHPTTESVLEKLKTIVVATEAKSDSVIVVPPATSLSFNRKGEKNPEGWDAMDLPKWLGKEEALNGLESGGLLPWHIVVTYDQFDEDGDNVHSGVYEEFWAGPKRFKRTYKSDDLNQTDFATEKGLYRLGDQQWPDQACGLGWSQTVYNQVVVFHGRNIARDVDVTTGGKAYLTLRVDKIETIANVEEAMFMPPKDAVGPFGGRISGGARAQLVNNNMSTFPRLPAAFRGQHVAVTVQIVVGKDGHVCSAHGVSGPKEAYKACEDEVRKWVFKPFLILGKPVEVEQTIEFRMN